MNNFLLQSRFKPTGDQPQAIERLVAGIRSRQRFQTLLGVTGSGKTFTLAGVIEKIKRPILVISPNKTLAAQLYAEFKEFFPHNCVEYFVSYYDYYQPESYIPQTDTYIEKDASINDRLDRLRLSATSALLSRRDVIVVASVSCIYNLGAPQDYSNLIVTLATEQIFPLENLLRQLIRLQYERNDFDFKRSTFRVKGDTVDIFPAYKEYPLRVQFSGDRIEKIVEFEATSGTPTVSLEKTGIYPAKHFIMANEKIEKAFTTINAELREQISLFQKQGKIVEAERLRSRTAYDMEMLRETGYCHGIENYSRHLSGREPGSRPYCLLDYFPEDFLTVIDESHITIPQIRGMYEGDKSRKEILVEYGFRLPSCLDNRPLRFEEFQNLIGQVIFVSATPALHEMKLSQNNVVEQIIRPTGLPDPEIEVRPTRNQIEDLTREIRSRTQESERSLVTTLTKRMAEELSRYLKEEGLQVEYIHSEIVTIERAKILKDLRLKRIDCLIGINLLREGIDLPEVSFVAVLDADKEGFLRSSTSLIQIAGRCARHLHAKVIMYADRITPSMQHAIQESRRRRQTQLKYNHKHHITPKTIEKNIKEGIEIYYNQTQKLKERLNIDDAQSGIIETLSVLEQEMRIAAKNLQFEKAARIRDKILQLRQALHGDNFSHEDE